MRVILLKDVRNVGHKDEIKDVADGFANNFLLRQNLAVPASPDRVAALDKKRAEHEAAQAQDEAKVDESVRSLAGDRIEVPVRATPKGGLFKALQASDIAKAIADRRGITVPAGVMELEQPIKTVGEHILHLRSKHESSTLTFVITPTE